MQSCIVGMLEAVGRVRPVSVSYSLAGVHEGVKLAPVQVRGLDQR